MTLQLASKGPLKVRCYARMLGINLFGIGVDSGLVRNSHIERGGMASIRTGVVQKDNQHVGGYLLASLICRTATTPLVLSCGAKLCMLRTPHR
jgi:hypothetical protein